MPSEKQIEEFLWEAKDAKIISVDTETTGLNIYDGRDFLMGISIAFKGETGLKSMYFPFRHPSHNIDRKWLRHVKWIIEHVPWIAYHHAKFDIASLQTIGIYHEGRFYDSQIMANLINELRPFAKSLDALCRHYLGPGIHKEMHPTLRLMINTMGWGGIPGDVMYAYADNDAVITYLLVEHLLPLLKKELDGDMSVWVTKQKMVRLLIKMKQRGVRVDIEACQRGFNRATEEMAEAEMAIGFTPTPSKIGDYFIKKLGLPVLKYTKGGKPSFTSMLLDEYEQMVERINPNDNVVQEILRYRGWQKTKASFYGAWMEHVSPDGRLRPDYVMHKDPDDGGTTTGRLSCREPNLQQIPRISTKEWHKDVKPALIPADGYVLIEADYSQLELRLSAAYSGESSLIRVFREGRDIFDEMSMRMGLTRDKTKTFVYSTQYGAGIKRLMDVFGVNKAGAQQMRDTYFAAYPKMHAFGKSASARVRQTGKIRIWSGRYRHFLDKDAENHKAMNACIQGGAADIVENIMVKCFETFDHDEECRMLMQIHDAIVFEVRKDKFAEYLPKIVSTMESVNEIADFGVPFSVDAHYWGTKEKLN